MAETLTVDPTPEAEVAGEVDGVQLSAEEQDSLQVGTEIQEAQEGSQQELVKQAGQFANSPMADPQKNPDAKDMAQQLLRPQPSNQPTPPEQ